MRYKKIVIGILLFVLSFFVPCYFITYKLFQSNFKHQAKLYIKTYLQQKDITVIEISSKELYHNSSRITWLDDNKEFVFNQKLYDVITVKEKNGSIVINALSDDDEKELKTAFSETFAKWTGLSGEPSSAKKNGLATFFIQDYIIPSAIQLTNLPYNLTTSLECTNNMILSKEYICKLTPPPKKIRFS